MIQGAAPIDVGEATSYTLNGLTPGGTYHFRVQSFDTQRRLGALSNDFVLIVTDGIDANLDGLPDDWKTFNNIGAGTLTPVIAPDATWLVTTLNGDVLQIRVNKAGMAAGRYVGHVIVSGAPGNHTQDSPQSITVDVWLAAGNPPIGYYRVFLPLTKK